MPTHGEVHQIQSKVRDAMDARDHILAARGKGDEQGIDAGLERLTLALGELNEALRSVRSDPADRQP